MTRRSEKLPALSRSRLKKPVWVRCNPESWMKLKAIAALRKIDLGELLERLAGREWRRYEKRIRKTLNST